MDDILIREATPDDIPHILHHRRSMFWEMGHHEEGGHRQMLANAESYLRDSMPRDHYRGWLAEAQGRVVAGAGVAIVPWPGSPEDPAPRRGWILNVYTEPEYRGRGVARRLMDTVVGWCREEGFVNVSLHASVFGRPLYEKMGFLPTNEMRLRLK